MPDITDLSVENYTLRDLRVAAQTARACKDYTLARQFRELHDARMMIDPQPTPVHTDESKEVFVEINEDAFPRAARLLRERKAFGMRKYGTPLKTHNGRDPRVDELQELLDACYYRKQGLLEKRKYCEGMSTPYLSTIEDLAKAIESDMDCSEI